MPITVQPQPTGITHNQPALGKNTSRTVPAGSTFTSGNLHAQSNLVAYYDSRYVNGLDGILPSNGSQISQWNDLSGNGNHLFQATQADQPFLMSGARNLLTYNQATGETDNTGMATAGTNCSLARSTATSKSGGASFAITTSAAGNFNCGTNGGVNGTPVQPNTQYTATFSGKWATTGRNMTVEVWMYDGSGVFQTAASTSATVGSTSTWTQKSVTFTTPSNVYLVAVKAWGYSAAAAGEIMYIDELGLWEGSSTTWTPPATLPNSVPVVQFNRVGNPGGMSTSGAVALSATNTSVYVISFCDTFSQRNGWFGMEFTAPSGRMSIVDDTVSQLLGGVNVSNDTFTGVYPSVADTSHWQVVSGVWGPSNYSVRWQKNGILSTANSGSVVAKNPSGKIVVGRFDGTTGPSAIGSVALVAIYNEVHDTNTRISVEQSLAGTYGITLA